MGCHMLFPDIIVWGGCGTGAHVDIVAKTASAKSAISPALQSMPHPANGMVMGPHASFQFSVAIALIFRVFRALGPLAVRLHSHLAHNIQGGFSAPLPKQGHRTVFQLPELRSFWRLVV